MVKFWLRNIDENSRRHPYLYETKPLKLSLIKSFNSSDQWDFRNNTYSFYKLMLSFQGEVDKCFATSIKPRYQILFFGGGKNTDSTFWFKFWATNQSVSISKNLAYYIISYKDYVCYISACCSSTPSSLNITSPSPNLSCMVLAFFYSKKWKFCNHFFIDFFLIKQNLDAQFLFTFSSLQEVILHYHYLFR